MGTGSHPFVTPFSSTDALPSRDHDDLYGEFQLDFSGCSCSRVLWVYLRMRHKKALMMTMFVS